MYRTHEVNHRAAIICGACGCVTVISLMEGADAIVCPGCKTDIWLAGEPDYQDEVGNSDSYQRGTRQ